MFTQITVCMYYFIYFLRVLLLGFYNQLIITVLCSFDSNCFPEIKKNKTFVPKCFRMVNCPSVHLRFGEERRWEPRSVFFLHFNDCLLWQKVVSFPFK